MIDQGGIVNCPIDRQCAAWESHKGGGLMTKRELLEPDGSRLRWEGWKRSIFNSGLMKTEKEESGRRCRL